MTTANEEYLKGQIQSGLKVGDRVRIISKAESCAQGWSTYWSSSMNEAVGKTGIITSNKGLIGFMLDIFEDDNVTRSRHLSNFAFPYFVLEKIC